MARCAPSGSRRRVLCLTVAALAVALAGCFTGERPHLADAPGDDRGQRRRRRARPPRPGPDGHVHGRLRRADEVRRPADAGHRRPGRRRSSIDHRRRRPLPLRRRHRRRRACSTPPPAATRSTPGRSATPSWRPTSTAERGGPPASRRRRPHRRHDGLDRGHRRRDGHVRGDPGAERARRPTARSTTARWPASTPPTWSSR